VSNVSEKKRESDSERPPRDSSPKLQRFVAGLAVVALIGVIGFVLRKSNERPTDTSGPFDPTTTNEAELRRVTESVSRVIAAPDGRPHENAVEVLESLAVQSAGARDLKDACVSTYRGLITSRQKLEQVRAILVSPDGGMRPQTELAAGEAARASILLREADEERERVTSTRNRCHDLYAIAARRFGLALERPRGQQ
jgi:hypothetical protein